MKTLFVTQLKPNPAGKDRPPFGHLDPSQLAGEWVDIKNIGASDVNVEGASIYNRAFSSIAPQGHWKLVVELPVFVLPVSKVLRVHAGKGGDFGVIRAEDRTGCDYDMFTGHDQYVWNNKEGDTAALWEVRTKQWIDSASYDPNPPEGVILVRQGMKLEPAYSPAYRYR